MMMPSLAQPLRRPAAGRSAYDLLMDYEQTLTEAVEAVIAEGLHLSGATVEARQHAAVAWREPLLVVAAEELSDRLARQAARGATARVSPSMLRQALAPYASLVAAAARAEMARQSQTSMAAD